MPKRDRRPQNQKDREFARAIQDYPRNGQGEVTINKPRYDRNEFRNRAQRGEWSED
jgi:hypothetical protein